MDLQKQLSKLEQDSFNGQISIYDFRKRVQTYAETYHALQLKQTVVNDSANYHAKEIVKRLTSRPHLEDKDGFYDMVNDEIQMIKIVEDYLSKNYE